MRLTALQAGALQAIREGRVSMVNTGHAAFRTRGANPSIVGRLVSLGLAAWPKGPVGEQTCMITGAGLAALSEDAAP